MRGAAPTAAAIDNGDEKEIAVVSPEFWSVISMGVVILIAIATSHRSLRREMDRLSERVDRLSERVNGLSERLGRVEDLAR